MYRDEAVLQTHLASPRVAKTRGAYAEFIESRKIVRCTVE
jgi:quinol monooxygenase YgiN